MNATITGDQYTAALASKNDGTIERCSTSGTVTGNNTTTGGLVALNQGTITRSSTTTSVNGTSEVGGLVGYNSAEFGVGTVSNSFATGNVTGSGSYIGGLIGQNYQGNVEKSYSSGAVVAGAVANNYTAGLIGRTSPMTSSVIYSFSVSNVNGSNRQYIERAYNSNPFSIPASNYVWSGSTFINCAGNCNASTKSSHANITDFYNTANPPMTNGTSNWDFTTIWEAQAGALPTLR